MQIYLKSKDERIWQMVVKGYIAPAVTAIDGSTSPKPDYTWDDNDLNNLKWNNHGLSASSAM